MRADSQIGGRLPGLRRWRLRPACGVGSALLACLALSADAGALPAVEVPVGGSAVELPHLGLGTSGPSAAESSGVTPFSVQRLSVTPTSVTSPSGAQPSVTSPSGDSPGAQPPRVEPPRLEVPPLEASKPSVPSLLPSGGQPSPPSPVQPPGGDRKPGTGTASVPVLAAPTRSAVSTGVGGREWAAPGAAAGNGGVLAPAQKSRPAERAARSRASRRGGSGGASVPRPQSGFELVAAPASGPAPAVGGTSTPGGLGAALAPLRDRSTLGLAAWLAAVVAGLALIGLMCGDALGAGPRHAYPRRRRRLGRRWPRWP